MDLESNRIVGWKATTQDLIFTHQHNSIAMEIMAHCEHTDTKKGAIEEFYCFASQFQFILQ